MSTTDNIEFLKADILEKAKVWFRDTIAINHQANTAKLKNPIEFDINPFLAPYLGAFIDGEVTANSVAKGLIYPRVLGTSITTSFGSNMQKFVAVVLKSTLGSTTTGIDIEFMDQIDGRRKYCQIKLGPNTINADDVITIHHHFDAVRNLAKTNHVPINLTDLVVGVLYGKEAQVSGHYKALRDDFHYPLYVGQEFWKHLTGDEDFYHDLIQVIGSVAVEVNGKQLLENTINALAASDAMKVFDGED